MQSPSLRVVAAAFTFAVATWGALRANADLELELLNGNKVAGTFLPAGETETFRAFIPGGARVTASATGVKVKKNPAPVVAMTVLDPDEFELEDAPIRLTGTGTKLSGYVTEVPGTYTFRLTGSRTGNYGFSLRWKSPSGTKKLSHTFEFPGEELIYDVSADSGAVLNLAIAAARGSASKPRITYVESADGEWSSDFFDPPANESAPVHRVQNVRLGGVGGDYVVHTEEAGDEGGDAVLTVTIRPPKAAARRVDVSTKQTGTSDLNQYGKGAVIGPDGGEIDLLADVGSAIDGSSLTVPSGALSKPVVIVITTGAPIPSPDGTQPMGPGVSFGPDGLKFNETEDKVYATIPFDPEPFDGDFSTLDIYVEDAKGKVTLVEPKTDYVIDSVARTVSFPVAHFSTYQVFGPARPRKRDLNNDGFDDLIVPAPAADGGRGRVYVFFGERAFAPSSVSQADAVFSGSAAGAQYGASVAAGDVNGDGVADLIVGSPGVAGGGRVDVYPGGTSFSAATAPLTFTAGAESAEFGFRVLAADVDGDKKGDLVVADPGAGTVEIQAEGAVHVFVGGAGLAAATAADADIILRGGIPDLRLGVALAAGKLIDGTTSTLLISSVDGPAGPGSGTVHVIAAGSSLASGNAFDLGVEYSGDSAGDEFGDQLGIGDVNGDGLPDLVVGAPSASPAEFEGGPVVNDAGSVYVFFGPDFDGGGAAIAEFESIESPETGQQRGRAVAVGNFTGDSFPDIAVGIPGHDASPNPAVGRLSLQRGGDVLGASMETVIGAAGGDRLGTRFLPIADVNGDGRDDLAASAPGASGGAGRIHVYLGPGLEGPRNFTIAGAAGDALGDR